MIIYSGHDDNVASFMMNFFPENYKCIADNFKSNETPCFEEILFTSNVLMEIHEEENNFSVILSYNGKQVLTFGVDDLIKKLDQSDKENYKKFCQISSTGYKHFILLLEILLLIITAILIGIIII